MRLRPALLLLALFLPTPSILWAADVTVTITDKGFTPDTVTMRVGDRLVVTNRTNKKQWIWSQGGNYAFDYRATAENNWTHEPNQSFGIVIPFAGKYRVGNAFDGTMHAGVTVGP